MVRFLWAITVAFAPLRASSAPVFPLQFTTLVETTAHLVDRAKAYPPWRRRVYLRYDYVNRRARAEVREGLDSGKNLTRRYDASYEYGVRGGDFPDCLKTYLGAARRASRARDARNPLRIVDPTGEAMPRPAYPENAAIARDGADIDGRRHDHWVVDVPGAERTHIYVDSETQLPRRLVPRPRQPPPYPPNSRDAQTNEALVDGAYEPLMTYDFVEFEAVAPAEEAFALDAPWTHEACNRHARGPRPLPPAVTPIGTHPPQVGGWPYVHLFHHYLMV